MAPLYFKVYFKRFICFKLLSAATSSVFTRTHPGFDRMLDAVFTCTQGNPDIHVPVHMKN